MQDNYREECVYTHRELLHTHAHAYITLHVYYIIEMESGGGSDRLLQICNTFFAFEPIFFFLLKMQIYILSKSLTSVSESLPTEAVKG